MRGWSARGSWPAQAGCIYMTRTKSVPVAKTLSLVTDCDHVAPDMWYFVYWIRSCCMVERVKLLICTVIVHYKQILCADFLALVPNVTQLISLQRVCDLLFADDCALVSQSAEELQEVVNCFAEACKDFGLTISTKKTEIVYQPPPYCDESQREPPIIKVHDTPLKVAQKFCYLGSEISEKATLDDEIQLRISKLVWLLVNLKSACGVHTTFPCTPKSRCTGPLSLRLSHMVVSRGLLTGAK